MLPAASDTWESPRTRVSSDPDSDGGALRLPLSLPVPIALLPVITASACAYARVNTVENAALIVSVRMYVPLTIATPRTIAIAVNAALSFRPSSPFRATRVTTAGRPSLERSHHLEDLGGASSGQLLDDQAIREEQDPIGDRGGARLMGDHHDRLLILLD